MTEQIDRHAVRRSTPVHRYTATLASVVLLVATAAVGVAACGGSQNPSNSGSSGGSAAVTGAVRYSACMRSHGVTNFPDPHVSRNGNHRSIGIDLNPSIVSSPAFKSAQKTCGYLVQAQTSGSTGAQQQAEADALLAFARCMRAHGFPSFPDPNTQGQAWTLAMLTNAGINLKEPAVRPTALTCTSVTHGILTKADVENAIANPDELGNQAQAAP
jgi:hypothetical protein